jgi:hypothetical protein
VFFTQIWHKFCISWVFGPIWHNLVKKLKNTFWSNFALADHRHGAGP